jgi:hypothetical protein
MKRIGWFVGALSIVACGGDDGGGADGSAGTESADTEAVPSSESDAGESSSSGGVAEGPTYHGEIAPILRESCGGCHVEGGIAPFPLENYDDAATYAPLVALVVENRSMPPWHAIETDTCTPPLPFLHDPRLHDDAIQAIVDWADAGAPEGDPNTAAPLPPFPDLSLPNASGEYPMPSAVELESSEDEYWCYSLDLGLDRDVWITGAQLVPSNRAIVHHVLVYTDPEAQSAALVDETGRYECFGGPGIDDTALFGAYIPGALPIEMPANAGVHLPAGARIVLGYHFHPTGSGADVDQSTLALRWTESEPERVAEFRLLGNFRSPPELLAGEGDRGDAEFRIPAGSAAHVETMEWTVPDGLAPARLFAVGNHMHYVGADMQVDILRAGGGDQCLLQTPGWDFGWQRAYFYDGAFEELPMVGPGDTVRLRCTYDNSLANDDLHDALGQQDLDDPIDVFLGEGSLAEMCMTGIGLVR